MSGRPTRFTVVGGGLGGALMAIYLGRAGHEVELFEMRPDPRGRGVKGGRSINLAISTRGIAALERVGLAEEILAMAVPMRGRMMHSENGKLAFQPYGARRGEAINSVSRAGLNLALLEAADRNPDVRLRFEVKCRDVDLAAGAVTFENTRTAETEIVRSDVIVGADGAFSAVRSGFQRLDRFNFSQAYLEHGYKELSIPPADGGGFRLEPNALHIWPRGGFMMIALPNHDGSFTCTLFWPLRGRNSFESLETEDDVSSFFRRVFADAVPHMPTLVDDYFRNPTSSLVTVRCFPWHYEGRAVLLGDACHAVVPFYGQGANAAFEDCPVLDACMQQCGPDWGKAFALYESRRKEHTDTLADLAVANFFEMRDHVSSRLFLMKKRGEKMLHRLFPWWFVPLYSMITFSRIPYADAVRKARRQARTLRVAAGVVVLIVIAVVLIRARV